MMRASTATNFIIWPRLPWAAGGVRPEKVGQFERAAVHLSGFRTACEIESISPLAATLRGQISAKPGANLAVELTTGQRPAGTVAWINGHSFGVEFSQTIDVLGLIYRNLLNQPLERRRMPRVEVRCAGWLKHIDEISEVTIRNVSEGGLQLEGDALMPPGTEVTVYVEGLSIPPCELIWKRDNLGGVEFRHELGWALILPWLRTLAS